MPLLWPNKAVQNFRPYSVDRKFYSYSIICTGSSLEKYCQYYIYGQEISENELLKMIFSKKIVTAVRFRFQY